MENVGPNLRDTILFSRYFMLLIIVVIVVIIYHKADVNSTIVKTTIYIHIKLR